MCFSTVLNLVKETNDASMATHAARYSYLNPSDHHQLLGKRPYILAPNKSALCRIVSLLAFSIVLISQMYKDDSNIYEKHLCKKPWM